MGRGGVRQVGGELLRTGQEGEGLSVQVHLEGADHRVERGQQWGDRPGGVQIPVLQGSHVVLQQVDGSMDSVQQSAEDRARRKQQAHEGCALSRRSCGNPAQEGVILESKRITITWNE